MKIKKILVSQPRPANEKSPYYELEKNANVKLDFRPFIKVESIPGKEVRKSRVNFLDYTAVIFTSRTAIDHYFRVAGELKYDIPETMKYFCISEAIAFYLQKYIVYRKRKIFFGNGKFDDLLKLIVKHKNEKYVLPLADIHKQDIPRKLKSSKINFIKAILYRTVSCDLKDITENKYDMFVFFSPSGIRSLLNNFPDFEQKDIKIATFGTSTAKAVRDAGLRLDIQAPLPNAPSMPKALEIFLQQYNK